VNGIGFGRLFDRPFWPTFWSTYLTNFFDWLFDRLFWPTFWLTFLTDFFDQKQKAWTFVMNNVHLARNADFLDDVTKRIRSFSEAIS
jgi:hypothetical protein